MATKRQIAANRANAKLSTGPKSLEGRLRSSRNALRHGLSSSLVAPDEVSKQFFEAMAELLSDRLVDNHQAASTFASAQARLLKIRGVRAEMFATFDRLDPQKLKVLSGLDRYERLALTQRRRALEKLQV